MGSIPVGTTKKPAFDRLAGFCIFKVVNVMPKQLKVHYHFPFKLFRKPCSFRMVFAIIAAITISETIPDITM